MLDDILLQVNKPGRYIGGEWNAVEKDFAKAEIKFALCFPDLYEIGMSNLGLRIIYGILNSAADIACERFFSPGMDMEKILRNNRLEILSLESQKPLKEFDFIGFSLGYELCFTNVLNILDLGAIPLKSSLRDNGYPLVIGGGISALNPEPMHEFFDFFIIGEAEEAILEIADIYRKFKHKFRSFQINKQDFLTLFSAVEGVYAPSLYDVVYDSDGRVKEFKPKGKGVPVSIRKRFIKDFNNAYFPLDWLIPYISIVHDRITLELMRGCPNKCRFCQARSQYFPFRQREADSILNIASQIYKRTGYEDISLCGLSVSEYAKIEELLKKITDYFKAKGVSVSLPSIKPKTIVGNLSSLIATVKKTGLTFAPEAASDRLRKIIGKDFNFDDFLKTIEQAYAYGWQRIKLYFMIGLPCEDWADLDAIADFILQASELRKKVNLSSARAGRVNNSSAYVNASINTLIPKAHTPFQWFKMEDMESVKNKQDYLKNKIKNKKIKLSFHNYDMSLLEGVFSRGDRRLSEVILASFKNGARFDSWENHFVFDKWIEAFRQCNIDPGSYLKEKSKNEFLAWDFIDTGIDKQSLIEESRGLT